MTKTSSFSTELAKLFMLAYRDVLKFLRDRGRIVATFVFPIVFVGGFGITLQSGLKNNNLGFDYTEFVFSGILMQTVFQSSFMGIVSLVSDREKDFASSIFVAPVSRFTIVLGKMLGESMVSILQAVGVLAFGFALGMRFPLLNLILVFPLIILSSLVGAALGVLAASRVQTADDVQRIFPFIVFPLIFMSGAFTPVRDLPLLLEGVKLINPLYYGVDLMRHALFLGTPALQFVTNNNVVVDLGVFVLLGLIAFVVGTILFSYKEGNR